MKIGLMNNPFNDVYEEISWIGQNNFDFVDLTLEPPMAQPQLLDANRIKELLIKYNLNIIGHTCYYLPYAHPIPEIREASIIVFKQYINFLHKLGAKKINIHVDKRYPDELREVIRENHVIALNTLATEAHKKGMSLMFENTHSGLLSSLEDLQFILDKTPDVLLHLDLGHAHVAGIKDLDSLFKKYSERIGHIHLSDNNESFDQHLVLGAGTINLVEVTKLLKKYLPDITVSLEVFANETQDQRLFQLLSREKLQQIDSLV